MTLAAESQHTEPRPSEYRDDAGDPALNSQQVLDCLEPFAIEDNDNAPRGILFGALIGSVAWAVVLLILAVVR